jgi:hypothetical protein
VAWGGESKLAELQAFVLLDLQGNETPPKVPELYSAPFGVLITRAGGIGMCTATHLGSGIGVTAAHCVHQGAEHYVIFYTKGGQKVAYPVLKFPYVGSGNNDIAAFQIGDDAAALWDAAGSELAGASQGAVRIWSFTPLQHFPNLQNRSRGAYGMVFTPNRCTASHIRPRIEAWAGDPERKLAQIEFSNGSTETEHLFVDKCERPIVKGNSGSLVTSESGFQKKIGILHYTSARKSDITQYLRSKGVPDAGVRYAYTGVDNRAEKVLWDLEEYIVGTATLLDVIAKASPGTLPGK